MPCILASSPIFISHSYKMESKNFFINKNFAPLEISTTKQAGIIVLDTYSQERNKYVLDLISKVKSFGYDLDAYLYQSSKFPLYGHWNTQEIENASPG